jgi:Toprim domain-containing protein
MHGLIGKSDSERLTFLGLAEHAKVVGSANPCGLFAALVRRQCWHFVTDSDEDVAHQRFKAHLYGANPPTRGSPQPQGLVQPDLSKDAAIVRYLQTQLARAGFEGDVFGLVSRDDASWTRERWDQAVHELEEARYAWQQGNAVNRLSDLMEAGASFGGRGSTTSACAHASAAWLHQQLAAFQAALPGSRGAAYLQQRGIPLTLAQQLGVGYAAPGTWLHAARDWRGGRVVFPHTTPDGRLVNLYGRAVGTAAQVPKAKRHDHLPGVKGYFNAAALQRGVGPLWVCDGAFDALALLAAGVPRVVALFGVQGWRWDWVCEVRELVFALDADVAGQQQWRQLARQAVLRGKRVAVLPAAAYGECKDVSDAWATGVRGCWRWTRGLQQRLEQRPSGVVKLSV